MTDTPIVQKRSPEELAAIRAEFGHIAQQISEDPQSLHIPATPPKRGPGRPRKNPEPVSFDDKGRLPILETPTLTKRDSKEVAARLSGILEGATGVLGVAKPYLAMTNDEAKAISDPLASYLIRTEATSVIASFAYMVRVYNDASEERAQDAERKRIAKQPQPTQSQSLGVFGGPTGPIVEQSSTEHENGRGEADQINRVFASASEIRRTPSDL